MADWLLSYSSAICFGLSLGWIGIAGLFVYRLRMISRQESTAGAFRKLSTGVIIICISLSAYQARWQLLGFFSSDFLRVQRGFDPRGEILGARFHRGSILDHDHQPLAVDTLIDGHLRRRYALGEAAVHVVGYNDPRYGSSGMEKIVDPILMGRAVQTPADAFRMLRNIFFHRTLRGNPVVLTIDRELQMAAWESLAGKTGSIVALDPRSGAIRAMVSRPGFDPESLDSSVWNKLLKRSDSPFLNRASHGLYPPGSTFKILVAAAALREGKNPVYTCGPGGFDCGPADPRVKDHAHYSNPSFRGHGALGLSEAMAVSCNVYFSHLAVDLTAPVILETARNARLDKAVPFRGPSTGSEKGRLPERTNWHVARTARLGIGQDDILVTPLHLAWIAGAVGNGGLACPLRLVETEEPGMAFEMIDHRIANRIARMMIKTVETGTGRGARVDGVIIGGKTGTAEHSGDRSHGLFVCFAPWPRPALAIAVVVDHGGMGGQVAAPIAAKVLSKADALGMLEDPGRSE